MKSDLIEYLPLTTHAKVFLKSILELVKWREKELDIEKFEDISLHDAFVDSKLSFTLALSAWKELEPYGMVYFEADTRKNIFYYKRLLVSITNQIVVENRKLNDKQQEDLNHVCELLKSLN